MSDSRLFDLVALSVDAVMDESRWFDICDMVSKKYGLCAVTIFPFPLHSSPREHPFASEQLRSNDSSILHKFMDADDSEDITVYREIAKLPPQRFYPEAAIMGVGNEEELFTSKMRDLMFRELGVRSRIGAKMNLLGSWMDMMALHAPRRSGDLGPKLVTDMNAVLPIFARCLNTHRAMATLKQQFGACLAALDRLSFGTALIDEAGRIAYANARMIDILSDRDGIARAGDALLFADHKQRAAFADGLRRACDPRTQPGSTALLTLSVPRQSGRPAYFLKLHAISDTKRETDIAHPFALLFAVDPARSGSISPEGIGALDVLSPAELDVCRYLLVGADTRDIADQRNVSLETTRQQIKSVLGKLNCRNRSHLLNVALTTHLPLRDQ